MATPSRYKGHHRERMAIRRNLAMEDRPCWICCGPIDYAIKGQSHPYHFEVDELVPVSRGGSPTDPDNVAPAHRICNNWRGNRSVAETEATKAAVVEAYGGWSDPIDFVRKAKSLRRGKPPAPSVQAKTTTDW